MALTAFKNVCDNNEKLETHRDLNDEFIQSHKRLGGEGERPRQRESDRDRARGRARAREIGGRYILYVKRSTHDTSINFNFSKFSFFGTF